MMDFPHLARRRLRRAFSFAKSMYFRAIFHGLGLAKTGHM